VKLHDQKSKSESNGIESRLHDHQKYADCQNHGLVLALVKFTLQLIVICLAYLEESYIRLDQLLQSKCRRSEVASSIGFVFTKLSIAEFRLHVEFIAVALPSVIADIPSMAILQLLKSIQLAVVPNAHTLTS
jgi:hypothetical protein